MTNEKETAGAGKRALVAMSGGVDSSVAAYLTQQAGYDCVGCTMKLFAGTEGEDSHCCSLSDVEDARTVAARLGIPYYVFNFTDDFREKIMDAFVCAYARGETPNPCIDCNRYMKFDKLFDRAKILGCDCVVSGHYARIERDGGRLLLKKARDAGKDQSYVLYRLTPEQLAHVRFPLGDLCKSEVRALAEEQGFLNARKKDSQDICFVPDGDYAAFIERYTGKTFPPGDFITPDGRVLGRHRGLIHYTIGQRKGLGLALPAPLYVSRIDPATNTVTLSPPEGLFTRTLYARDLSATLPEGLPAAPARVTARARYHQPEQPATACVTDDGRLRVTFDEPVRAVTPGQAVVLYDGDTVLGGGVIESAEA